MQTETLKQYRDDAQFILVGIGEEWKEHGDPDRLEKACAGLKGLLEGKEYLWSRHWRIRSRWKRRRKRAGSPLPFPEKRFRPGRRSDGRHI